MTTTLPENARELIDAPNLAYVATVLPDGSPQVTPVWIDRDGDTIRFNTAHGRTKPRNLGRDNRVAIAVADRNNPYRYAQIRGRVAMTEDGAVEHINQLSHKYTGKDYPLPEGEQRIIVRVTPESVSP